MVFTLKIPTISWAHQTTVWINVSRSANLLKNSAQERTLPTPFIDCRVSKTFSNIISMSNFNIPLRLWLVCLRRTYRAFSHHFTAVILVFQNKETAASSVPNQLCWS